MLIAGCQDPASAPIPLTVTSEPAAQTAGGVITLTSQQFADITLVPSSDTTLPNRWSNFAVIVGVDTAESWRVGPTQIAFRVPPVLTGTHDARIEVQGYDRAQVSFFAVGLAFPLYWGGLNPYTDVSSGTVFPGRGLLVAEGSHWPGFTAGYGLMDVQAQSLRMYPELRDAATRRVQMTVPGPSYRANHFVFDLSPPGAAAATVWRADPWTPVDTIPCSDSRGSYTAVEMSSSVCLSLRFGVLVRNGVDTIASTFFPAALHDFRLAPGGKWAVVRTELGVRQLADPTMAWPVLDRGGNIAYTIDTLLHVTGAAFSNDGDTLYLTASVRDTTAQNYVEGRFSVVALETATGRILASRSFPSTRALQDVTLDPVRPLLYVGGAQTENRPDLLTGHRQYLTVLDRATLDIVADMPAPWGNQYWLFGDATLMYQGGRVSVVVWCGYDCGGLWTYTFDVP